MKILIVAIILGLGFLTGAFSLWIIKKVFNQAVEIKVRREVQKEKARLLKVRVEDFSTSELLNVLEERDSTYIVNMKEELK